jgi:excisionase family DNA binding protein
MSHPPSRWLTPTQAARYLGCSKSFLDQDRVKGLHGIPYSKLGKLVRYCVDDLDKHLESNRVQFGGEAV